MERKGIEVDYIYHKYWVIKQFGWEILKEDVKEVEKMVLIEDIKNRYENWLMEKREFEMKHRRIR